MTRFRLNALGPPQVQGDLSAPITQPRQLALLAYLVLARPRGRHSRDTLIALLWPESDPASGRQGLRNALYRLRTALGDDAIRTVGEGFVETAPGMTDSDVFAFERAVAESRWAEAREAYQGEFLRGFHVSDAPDFERWIDDERARLTALAIDATSAEAAERRQAGDLPGAIRAASFACGIRPDDERTFRQYLQLLRDAGDLAAARRAYDEFARRLRIELDAEPAPETAAMLAPLRREPTRPADDRETPTPAHAAKSADPRPAPPLREGPVTRRSLLRKAAGPLAVAAIAVTWRLAASAEDRAVPDAGIFNAPLDKRWQSDTALLGRYLRGQFQVQVARNAVAARDTFFRLSQDAPLYAPGWAGLALATLRSGFNDIRPADAFPRALAAAHRALAMDSTLTMATEALIGETMWGRWDLPAAKAQLDAALARHPDDFMLLNLLGTWYRWAGEFEKSLALKQANAGADPLSTVSLYQVVPSLYFGHRCAEAVTAYRNLPAEIRGTGRPTVLYASMLCAGMHEDLARALRDEAIALDSAHVRLFVEPMTRARTDSVIELVHRRRVDAQLARRKDRWIPPEHVMVNYAFRRHVDSTLVWLDSMIVHRSMMLYVVPFDPLMDFLRADPRFDAVLDRLTWVRTLGASQQRVIDSLRQVAIRMRRTRPDVTARAP